MYFSLFHTYMHSTTFSLSLFLSLTFMHQPPSLSPSLSLCAFSLSLSPSLYKATELFLQRMMALYVSSHYKNSPNDLQLMSDAPAHHLFVLLGPSHAHTYSHTHTHAQSNALPDILCVVQVCGCSIFSSHFSGSLSLCPCVPLVSVS